MNQIKSVYRTALVLLCPKYSNNAGKVLYFCRLQILVVSAGPCAWTMHLWPGRCIPIHKHINLKNRLWLCNRQYSYPKSQLHLSQVIENFLNPLNLPHCFVLPQIEFTMLNCIMLASLKWPWKLSYVMSFLEPVTKGSAKVHSHSHCL